MASASGRLCSRAPYTGAFPLDSTGGLPSLRPPYFTPTKLKLLKSSCTNLRSDGANSLDYNSMVHKTKMSSELAESG